MTIKLYQVENENLREKIWGKHNLVVVDGGVNPVTFKVPNVAA